MTSIGREFDLRTRVARPCERIDEGMVEKPGQFTGLVEAALILASPMERNGHDTIRIAQ